MHLKSPGWRYSTGVAAAGLGLSVIAFCPDLCYKSPSLLGSTTSTKASLGSAEAADASNVANIFVAYPPDNGKVPPIRYLTQWRLQVAQEKLRRGDQSIAQIAHAIGYESEAAFNRAFKRAFGEPPARWREQQVKADH